MLDLSKCGGCYTCVVACRALSGLSNPTPLLSILRAEVPSGIHYVPVPCDGCDEGEILKGCDMQEVASCCPTSAVGYGDLEGKLGEIIREAGGKVFSLSKDARIYYLARNKDEADALRKSIMLR